jgi:uncharacterized DUF497 family protein
VKRFSWNTEKNERLKKERAISFEEAVFHVQQGDLLDVLEHPDPKRFDLCGQDQRLCLSRTFCRIRGRNISEDDYSQSQDDKEVFRTAKNK